MPTSVDHPEAVAERVELFEGELWADLQLSASVEWRTRYKVDIWREEKVIALVAAGTRALAVNRVIGLGFGTPLTLDYLHYLIDRYREAGAERFVVQWSPRACPAEALDWMLELGATPMGPTTKLVMQCDNAPELLPTPSFEVREVTDGELFERIVAPALGVPHGLGEGIRSTVGQPGWRYYLAFDGERPIAGGTLYVGDTQAWLGFGATLPTDRRRGAQSALIRRRLVDAAGDGCVLASTETHASTGGEDRISSGNLQRAGFNLLYERPNLVFELATITR